ncbi:hypothetical protein KAX02_00480 [candidate division WOR-3 bacterium]|nr:hypothetical protein [candidate division WOR-3 bacterium]
MKIIESTIESLIIVLAFILIVLPEIAYSLTLRGRDWVIDSMERTIFFLRGTIKKL